MRRLFQRRIGFAGHHQVEHAVEEGRGELLDEVRGAPLGLHKAEALAAQDAAGDDAGHLPGGHHLRLVARRFALLRTVGREGRKADVRGRESRAGDHDVQTLLEVLDAERLEKARHGVFRGRIARAAGESVQPRHRRDAHDGAFRGLQIRQGVFAAVDRAPEVDVHQPVQHIELHVVEKRTHRQPGVADEDVDAAECAHGRVDQLPALFRHRDVDAAPGGLTAPRADILGELPELVGASGSQYDAGALRRIFDSHSLADSRRGARNDDDLSSECLLHDIVQISICSVS